MTEPIAVGIREAAVLVSVSEDTIRNAVRATDDTHLPAKVIGRKYSIKIDDLRAWHDNLPDA